MNIGQTALKYGIKAAGAAGVGIILYDAHKHGQYRANVERTNKEAIATNKWFENSRNVNSFSRFNSSLKDKVFKFELKENIMGTINAAAGYAKGFTRMIAGDIIPLGLSIAAIATKGTAAKVSGAALGIYSALGFAFNVLGIGNKPVNPMK